MTQQPALPGTQGLLGTWDFQCENQKVRANGAELPPLEAQPRAHCPSAAPGAPVFVLSSKLWWCYIGCNGSLLLLASACALLLSAV